MGTIKKGAANRYPVLTAVAAQDMRTQLANLGNAVVFYSQVSTTGGTASTKSYSNNNDFPTLTALTAGMIVQIGWTGAEVVVAVLGEANVASGSANYSESFSNVDPSATSLQLTYYPLGPVSVYRNGFLITSGVTTNQSTGVVSFPASGSSIPDDYTVVYQKGGMIPPPSGSGFPYSFPQSFN